MNKAPFGYIYRVTNKLTGETYIGQKSLLQEPWRKYLGSGRLIKEAIKIYGEDNFVKSFLCHAYSDFELSAMEEKLICHEKDNVGHGEYNISRFVLSPNVASAVGALASFIKAQQDRQKHYDNFIRRSANIDLIALFQSNPKAIHLANTLQEPLKLIHTWMTINGFADSKKSPNFAAAQKIKNEAVSIASKAMWDNPVKRASIVASQTGLKRSIQHRANISKALTKAIRDKHCLYCGEHFVAKKARVQFCSGSCSAYARHRGTSDPIKLDDYSNLE